MSISNYWRPLATPLVGPRVGPIDSISLNPMLGYPAAEPHCRWARRRLSATQGDPTYGERWAASAITLLPRTDSSQRGAA